MFRTAFSLTALWLALVLPAAAQITVTGVADRGNYPDAVTFTVVAEPGFTYAAFVNTNAIAVGQPVTVNRPDFYELRVARTNNTSGATAFLYLRFIVEASERADTEWGLPRQFAWPLITSSSNEFAGARLRLLAPSRFPTGYDIPVVAWVEDDAGHAVRANGFVAAPGHPAIQVRRGVGSGFLGATNSTGTLEYAPAIQALATNKTIALEANTTWTTVSGTLSGNVSWPQNSRIHITTNITLSAGATLTIGAGAIVRINSRCDITNNGAVVINGTREDPVVFMPNSRSQPWGGFIMRTGPASVTGTGVIFTGSGANPTWFGSPGNPNSHRPEQALFFVNDTQSVSLTDSAAMYLVGQLSHSVSGGTFTFNHFLMQRVTSGGEFTASTWNVNDSAFIECPDDSVNFVNGDHDALYFVSGLQAFTNTLFGWTKDDIIDSGGSGYGTLYYQSCWFEAAAHEGNSLSGYKHVFPRDTVFLGCGQGFEDGYDSPTGRVVRCLITDNLVGLRHGDNYDTMSRYAGILAATNCILLYNHRDIFGFNWRSTGGWTNAFGQIFPYDNWLTRPDTNFPNNFVWNPATDAWRLATFGAKGHVGVGFATWPGQSLLTEYPGPFAGGTAVVPVGLSVYCTNEVSLDYTIETSDGAGLRGTLVFPPGRTRHYLPVPANFNGVLRVALENPTNADLTGLSEILLQNFSSSVFVLSPLGATWKYLDNGSDQGVAWRAPDFDDSGWSEGPARLGFGADAAATTTLRRYLSGTSGPQFTNYYFRGSFVVSNDLSEFANLQFRYQRDDGCVLHLNGAPLITNNMPAGPFTFQTFAAMNITPAAQTLRFHTNNFPVSILQPGTNVIAVEVHQSGPTSSDIAWEMELLALPASTAPRLNIWQPAPGRASAAEPLILYWNDPTFRLEEADTITGPWRTPATTNSPVSITPEGTRFFRLRR